MSVQSGSRRPTNRRGRAASRTLGRYRATTMLYDVLVVSNGSGGKRFTTERDAPLSVGDTFEQDSESYRVLAIQPGHGPFDCVIEAEWLGSSGPGESAP